MLYVEPEWIADLQSKISNGNNYKFQPIQMTHSDCPFLYREFQSLAKTLIENESTIKVEPTAINFFSDLSHYYLIHSFKKQYGITPHAYQIVMRINRAKALLKEGENE